MKRFRAHISALYVLSVVFVALGHCWSASSAKAVPANAVNAVSISHNYAEAVAHRVHGQPDGISVEGCLGDETACASAISSPALLPALAAVSDPVSKSVILLSPAMPAFAEPSAAMASCRPPERRTPSPHSYAEAFARTGRLLI